MEDQLPALARWLGAHAWIVFAGLTAIALGGLCGAWLLARRYAVVVARHAGVRTFVAFALALAMAGTGGLASLADEIEPGEDAVIFDQAFSESLRAATAPWVLEICRYITRLGDTAWLVAFSAVVGFVLLARRHGSSSWPGRRAWAGPAWWCA